MCVNVSGDWCCVNHCRRKHCVEDCVLGAYHCGARGHSLHECRRRPAIVAADEQSSCLRRGPVCNSFCSVNFGNSNNIIYE